MSNVSGHQTVIMKTEKNPGLAAGLAFLFGPLGLLYSNTKAALIMFIPYCVSVALCFFLIGVPMVFACMVGSAFWAYKSCETYNKNLLGETKPSAQPIRSAA